MIFCSWQFIPKWKYTVHHTIRFENISAHVFDANGKPTNRFRDIHVKESFYSSKQAWASFWDKVVKRNGKIIKGGIITMARIDSVKVN